MEQREKALLAAQELRRDIIASGLSRRDLLKLGLLSGSGLLALTGGIWARSALGQVTGEGTVTNLTSPPTRRFVAEMPIPPTLQPVQSLDPHPTVEPNYAAGEGRTRNHQALLRFPPQKYYELRFEQGMHSWHPDLPAGPVWAPNGIFPGPMLYMRYGEPVLVRMYNDLPAQNLGFGIPSITTHLHNGHTPSESDGFPGDYHTSGQWYDHHYPNQCAGMDAYGDQYSQYGAMGDYREALGSLWYHDHRLDFTAQNVYAGMAGMAPVYDNLDSGDEHDSNPLALRLPSGEYDVPLIFHDRVFDSQGRSYFDLFNLDGIIGDKFTVNGVIQPFFRVQRRKYRFRMLNIGPSRFYRWFMSDGSPFTVIANDGNLLPAPVVVKNFWQSVAERHDIVIDFSKYKKGDRVRLVNRALQTSGRGPEEDLLKPGIPVLEFRVESDPPYRDESRVPAQLRPMPPLADMVAEAETERLFVFDRGKGAWQVNGQFFNVNRAVATPRKNSTEIWVIRNGGGGWAHPIHIHFEEHRFLSFNGRPPAAIDSGRKDVIRLEENGEVRVAIRFRDFEGRYPMHCHNVVHEDHSMMVRFDIVS
jgi:FtsP/CotA-like multicopper oxidase with cupredoxin domain